MANCGGPNNSKWDGERCVTSGAQTSCDSIAEDTCYYAALLDGITGNESEIYWLGGRFLDDGRFEIGLLVSTAGNALDFSEHGLLAPTELRIGDKINLLNGKKIKQKAFMAFKPKSPCRSIWVCRGSDGFCELKLRKSC